ncbi:MAG: TadE/TadG family type IV pilus assembly protein [Acidimicrobiales bacterium]
MTSRSLARQPRRRRFHGDDGSIIAESALLVPFFVLLLFGMLEFGGAFRDYLTLSNAASTGARQAGIQGNAASADWNIILAVKDAANAMPLSQITRIAIFKAATPTAGLPANCDTGGVAGCNSYDAATVASVKTTATMPASWANCTGPDSYYCPTGRSVSASNPDYLGVWVQIVHPWITGLFGKSITMTQTSIIRLEPQAIG